MHVTENARKRFTEEEIRHVWEHALRFVPHQHDGEERLLIIGALPDGKIAELVAVTADAPTRIIHANWIQQNHVGYLRGTSMTDTLPDHESDTDGDFAYLAQLTPETHPGRDAQHFRRIVAARQRVAAADAELRNAVAAARAAGDSWGVIGIALETTRQAAQQRFA